MQELVKEQADLEEVENVQAETEPEWNEKLYSPKGIEGWLIVVLIGMCISMFLAARQLFSQAIPGLFSDSRVVRFEGWSGTYFYDSEWTAILINDVVFNGALLIYVAYVFFEMIRMKSIVPRLMIILYSANLLSAIIRTCLILTTVEALDEEIKASFWAVATAFGICLIWIPYFMMSSRVENTFSE